MKLVRYALPGVDSAWAAVENGRVWELTSRLGASGSFLSALLQWPNPALVIREACANAPDAGDAKPFLEELARRGQDLGGPRLLAPLDHQEVWAAGVTYQRSRAARMEESEGAARFYDLVYDADRPELFLKAMPYRVSGPNQPVCIRQDAAWNVPEPEIGVLLTPHMRIVGYTIGNDVSSRDIEGENPLYLPQAKVYARSCALGPAILIEDESPDHREFEISLTIERQGDVAFEGTISTAQMKRRFADLASWLERDNVFPHGVFLLTGTGLVPGSEFTLEAGDVVHISVPEIGTLTNGVQRGR